MANVTNVNNYSKSDNVTSTKKISFDVGEIFSAQVLSADSDSGEVSLRTSDGWRFDAKVENFDQMQNFGGNGKFVVDGVKDGKVIIKLLDLQEKKPDSRQVINDELLKDLGLTNSKENIEMLKMLIEHNMPLTQENISKLKSIVDFKKNLNDNSNKSDEFILKFLQNKGIDINSKEGQIVSDKLKGFFDNFKNLNSEDILTFFENNLNLNEENIKSFNKLFKGESSLYKELENIDKSINNHSLRSDDKGIKSQSNIKNENTANNISEAIKSHNENIQANSSEDEKGNIKPNLNIDKGENLRRLNLEEVIKSVNESGSKVSGDKKLNLINNIKILDNLTKVIENAAKGNSEIIGKIKSYILENAGDLQNTSSKEVINQVMAKINPDVKLSGSEVNNILKSLENLQMPENNKDIITENKAQNLENSMNLIKEDKTQNLENNIKIDEAANLIKNIISSNKRGVENNSAQNVKEQINLKIENMKSFISNLIDGNKGDNSSLSQKVYDIIRNNANDFKVFNSISNEYYYMDVPINNNQNDYNCKLIIKDDRKSGKKVDSKNVKLITSVKTVNMGTVDAYIRVLENNMNINLKCEKEWVKIFNKSKDSIIGKISNMGYNINMSIDKKEDEEEVDLVSCRSFFNDNNSYSRVDVRV